MSEDLISQWADSVKKTAVFVCRDFPDVEKEDLSQHLFMKLLENQQYLKSPDEQGATTLLIKWGRQYAWDQRKEHLMLTSQYSYRTSDVRHILETVFDRRDWNGMKVPEDAKSEFNDVFLEMSTDVKRAWESLGHTQKKIIFKRYALGEVPELGGDRTRLSRAVGALTDKLNFYQRQPNRDYEATRKVITNANARHRISNSWDD